MQLTSSDIANDERIPERFTCEGEDAWPSFEWRDVPDDAVELAMVCEDPDAPRGTFIHWVMWGLEPADGQFKSGELPAGVQQGVNGFGTVGYRGPCPPPGHGPHHYHFILYALSASLSLDEGASIDDLRAAMEGAVLADARLVALYER